VTGWPPADPLARRAATTPERTAIVDTATDETWTYWEYDAAVDELAASLVAAGVQSGDSVGALLEAGPPFAWLAHAAWRAGARLVGLNARQGAEELAPQVRRAGVDMLVADGSTAGAAAALDVRAVTLESAQSPELEALPAGKREAPTGPRPPDADALVLFTSGTTGQPKGVRLTLANLVASATASAFRLGVSPADRWLCCLPMYHMGGLAPVYRSVLYGTTLVLQPSFDTDRTRTVIDEESVTGVSLVPTMLSRLLDAGWAPPPSLETVLVGGAATPPDLVERCEQRGVPVYPSYGMTEAASQIATARPAQAFEAPETVGQPLLTSEVSVLDSEGRRCEAGERGELVVDGPTVTPGYLDSDATADAFSDAGFHTGDLGYRTGDGRLFVTGRVDDRIVTGGENVDPAEVAAVLRECPGVEDAAVVGLDDAEWGERVAALVVGSVAVSDLEAHCRDRLAGYKRPKEWAVVDAFPRTASGTVDREAVRAQFGAD
jgi:O-succinylbenzoic acid--CoA ligase